MKQFTPLFILFLFCLFFTGCGKQEKQNSSWQGIQGNMEDLSAITDRSEYYDINVISRQFDSDASTGTFLGAQFFRGEPIELRLEMLPVRNNNWQFCLSIYRMDGSREILMSNPPLNTSGKCYLSQDGSCYNWVNSNTIQFLEQTGHEINTTLTKYLSSGEAQFVKEWNHEEIISDIRQMSDGRVYLILENSNTRKRTLLELNSDTGETTEITDISLYNIGIGGQYLGESDGSLALYRSSVYNEKDFIKFNPEDSSESFILSLNGTSYMFPAGLIFYDFQVLDNGSVEILWAAPYNSTGILETLCMEKVNRTPIILRGASFNSWLMEQINNFNQSNENYHVIPEPCGAGNDPDDFARLTSVQLSTGKGPDILYGDFMQDYLMGMILNGSLQDLRPFIEASGIRKEDYFSFVFKNWSNDEKIYGICSQFPYLIGYKTSKALLGNLTATDGETIIDALLAQREDMIYFKDYDSQALLNLFLSGSDSLLGMVNWEEGICSFDGEMLPKLLNAAKRYGDDGRTRQESYPTEEINFYNIFEYDSSADLEKAGMIQTGVLFDDGYHAAISSYTTLAVNANSAVKEGVWEFISFLLSQEAQAKKDFFPPIQKDAFEQWIEKERSKVADGKIFSQIINQIELNGSITVINTEYTEDDITEEKVKEYIMALENARPYPIRTIPILKIIQEEAEYYFNGSKTAKEVGVIITNRVQLYLDENR